VTVERSTSNLDVGELVVDVVDVKQVGDVVK